MTQIDQIIYFQGNYGKEQDKKFSIDVWLFKSNPTYNTSWSTKSVTNSSNEPDPMEIDHARPYQMSSRYQNSRRNKRKCSLCNKLGQTIQQAWSNHSTML
ncbi:hypothetical protein PsorP6_018423 [Peronosclerospora sorghi]|nr:hypothetical protein PsorP6_018402 [Peronosclerospora sorghi]KAI9895232.1 hypothetical protein PsorP6_018423 [Peronosclerospora sorghi]